jgi:hypothetical protein
MKTPKPFNKITKTIIADLLVWSQKANGIPKQEVIDQIFTGLNRGSIKKKGDSVTEYEYVDQGSQTRFMVDFAKKTIQLDDKVLYTFAVETIEKPVKAEKTKTEKEIKPPKQTKEEKQKAAMEQHQKDVQEFINKNFSIQLSPEGKVTKFEILNKDDKTLATDTIIGGIMWCLVNRFPNIKDADKEVAKWIKDMKKSLPKVDTTAKSPAVRKTTAEPVAAKKSAKKK